MFRDGTPPHHDLLFVLLATGAAACLVYSGASMAFPGWAAQYEPQLWLCGGGLVPFVLFLAGGWREWQRLGAQVDADRARSRAMDAETERKRAELAGALDGAQAGGDEAVITTPVGTPSMERAAMKTALSRFFRGGEQAGSFSIRALSSIVSDGDWAALTDFYCSDAGGRVLRDRGGPLGTAWGHGWTLDAVLQALNADRLPLPPFPEGQVPDVALYVANTTQRNGNTRKSKAGAVVDSVAREVGR